MGCFAGGGALCDRERAAGSHDLPRAVAVSAAQATRALAAGPGAAVDLQRASIKAQRFPTVSQDCPLLLAPACTRGQRPALAGCASASQPVAARLPLAPTKYSPIPNSGR